MTGTAMRIVLVMFALAGSAAAESMDSDYVLLRGGKKISGLIKSVSNDQVIILIGHGEIAVDRDRVTMIFYTERGRLRKAELSLANGWWQKAESQLLELMAEERDRNKRDDIAERLIHCYLQQGKDQKAIGTLAQLLDARKGNHARVLRLFFTPQNSSRLRKRERILRDALGELTSEKAGQSFAYLLTETLLVRAHPAAAREVAQLYKLEDAEWLGELLTLQKAHAALVEGRIQGATKLLDLLGQDSKQEYWIRATWLGARIWEARGKNDRAIIGYLRVGLAPHAPLTPRRTCLARAASLLEQEGKAVEAARVRLYLKDKLTARSVVTDSKDAAAARRNSQ